MESSYRFMSLFGLGALIALAWLCSENRRRVPWGLVVKGVGLQLVLAVVILRTAPGQAVFQSAGSLMNAVLGASEKGTELVFGSLGRSSPEFIFAFQISGTIILVSSLMAALYYIGVMQRIVWLMAKVMQVLFGTSGAESLAAAANVFAGQTEAPLIVQPYLKKMTSSELMALMTGGMTTIAGGVMAAYVGLLKDHFPDIAGHLLAASVMSAPASIVLAKIMIPETEAPETLGTVKLKMDKQGHNLLDAICHGASDGLKLSLNVMAMLIAFTALMALVNSCLGGVGGYVDRVLLEAGFEVYIKFGDLSLQRMLGWLCAPIAWLMGVDWSEAATVGRFIGEKTILNEFYAYDDMARTMAQAASGEGPGLSRRSAVIASYALCGFANFASIAIQIGGIGVLVPERRSDLARLGFRALIAGSLASFMTATIAGMMPLGDE